VRIRSGLHRRTQPFQSVTLIMWGSKEGELQKAEGGGGGERQLIIRNKEAILCGIGVWCGTGRGHLIKRGKRSRDVSPQNGLTENYLRTEVPYTGLKGRGGRMPGGQTRADVFGGRVVGEESGAEASVVRSEKPKREGTMRVKLSGILMVYRGREGLSNSVSNGLKSGTAQSLEKADQASGERSTDYSIKKVSKGSRGGGAKVGNTG